MSTHNIRHLQAQISSPGSIDMFDFRNGMLGVVIVALALGGAIFGAYFAGIESVEHEVVKYNELADVTGLFDTDKSPQYIDYDPSTNYVGYYSQESYSEEMDKYYFAADEVGFTESTTINNYKIPLEPIRTGQGVIESPEDPESPLHGDLQEIDFTSIYGSFNAVTTTFKLSDWVNNTILPNISTNDTNRIYLGSIESYSESKMTPGSDVIELDMLIFSTKNMWHTEKNGLFSEKDVLDLWSWEKFKQEGKNVGIDNDYLPYLSCIIYLNNNQVELFSDNQWSKGKVTYNLADVYVSSYGGTLITVDNPFTLGDSVNFSAYIFQIKYLDPNKGVYLKGDE